MLKSPPSPGAAQGHLRNKEVGTGDLFLFFGWFKKYASRGKELHHIFGWLQISEIICGNKNIKKYLDSINISHPHGHQEYTSNTIYNKVKFEKEGYKKIAEFIKQL